MPASRVVIVGAGAAGLAAAASLRSHGLQAVVLEARKRIGGRIYTVREAGIPVELGAEFVPGHLPAIRRLAQAHGLDIEDAVGEHWCSEDGRLTRGGGPLPDWARDRLCRLPRGFDTLIEALAAGANFRTATPVREIAWSTGGARLSTMGGEWLAERVIVTAPLRLLQETTALPFHPEIPEKRAAAGRLQMGHAMRISMRFREAFWLERIPHVFMLQSNDDVLPVWWTHATDRRILTGWAAGRRARNLSALPASEVLERALGALSRCLREDPRELTALVEWFHVHDWQSDPHARGAYAVERTGEVDATLELAKPVHSTLFFAGEATHPGGQRGTVHGAIETGMRAACEVIESLR